MHALDSVPASFKNSRLGNILNNLVLTDGLSFNDLLYCR